MGQLPGGNPANEAEEDEQAQWREEKKATSMMPMFMGFQTLLSPHLSLYWLKGDLEPSGFISAEFISYLLTIDKSA